MGLHSQRRNYLRIRGEEHRVQAHANDIPELPPHTRRRGVARDFCPTLAGITSAYAEKRNRTRGERRPQWNYLRIRGEESRRSCLMVKNRELPPHTRRRDAYASQLLTAGGITSAYAEKRVGGHCLAPFLWNYLRIRGEEKALKNMTPFGVELPPHTRRRAYVKGS